MSYDRKQRIDGCELASVLLVDANAVNLVADGSIQTIPYHGRTIISTESPAVGSFENTYLQTIAPTKSDLFTGFWSL